MIWEPEDRARLLACETSEELLEAFPDQSIANLRNRRSLFRKDLAKNGISTVKTKVVEDVQGEDAERTVPVAVYNRVLRQLDAVKRKRADYIATLYSAVSDAMATYSVGAVPKPKLKVGKSSEVCVPLLSDVQLAKKTPDYDSEVAEKRLYAYARI